MEELKLRESNYRLLDIIWRNEPIKSRELCQLAENELGWKKTTTFSVLKYLIENGFCENVNRIVRSLVSRDKVQRSDSVSIVKRRFDGSLPKFVTAFVESGEMTDEDAADIIKMLQDFTDKN